MNDLTILFITLNKLPEHWRKYHREVLEHAAQGARIVEISPTGELKQDKPPSSSNVYWQMLRGAKYADTEYIAMAEDDTLYTPDHYSYRPEKGVFAYNQSHWSLFNWGVPTYNWRDRMGNYTLIAHREDVIEALEERFAKYPDGTPEDKTGEIGRWRIEKQLGLTPRKAEEFKTSNPVINICHQDGLCERSRRKRKGLGTLRAFDIPYWGKAEDLIKKFNE